MKYVFFTEASQQVGYGHLFEVLSIAGSLPKQEVCFVLMDSAPAAADIIRRKGYSQIEQVKKEGIDRLSSLESSCIVMDTRSNSLWLQKKLRQMAKHLVVIDELGNKQLFCDTLINFSLCDSWIKSYSFDEQPHSLTGPQYYPLRREFAQAGNRQDYCASKKVLVSLGGADRTRTTLKIAEIFSGVEGFEFAYIIGPGFNFGRKEVLLKTQGKSNHKVIENPANFSEILLQQALLISSGGNTLFEAAYCGVPAVVLWEDTHESAQGQAFERRGTALVFGCGEKINEFSLRAKKEIASLVNNEQRLFQMSNAGRKLVDGKGCARIADSLRKCV